MILDLIGKRFGRLLVLNRVENNKWGSSQWLCQCDCGNEVIILGNSLSRETTISCGCFKKEQEKTRFKKYNDYFNIDEHTFGFYPSNTKNIVLIDKEDYDLVKEYCWNERKDGYIASRKDGKHLSLSIFIMNFPSDGYDVDHINRNKLDNRKENLRIVTQHESVLNRGLYSTNKTGIEGVQETKYHTWLASLQYSGKKVLGKTYKNKDDAIKARLSAEKKYYKEFAPQQYLFEEYGI